MGRRVELAVADEPVERRHPTGAHLVLEDRQAQPVELDHQQTRRRPSAACPNSRPASRRTWVPW